MPSLTEPFNVSPSTVPENSSVIGIGRLIEAFQLTALPLTLPSSMGLPSPEPALCVPVRLAPEAAMTSVLSCEPIGVLMVRFQVPSTAIGVSPI